MGILKFEDEFGEVLFSQSEDESFLFKIIITKKSDQSWKASELSTDETRQLYEYLGEQLKSIGEL